jgi:nitroreductase
MRNADHPILPLILNRWSSRSLSGEPVSREEILSLFEAARWAPSSFNDQPWRFIWAKKGSDGWDILFHLLVDANKTWCEKADVLCVAVGRKTFEKNGKPSVTFAYDTGAAWENLALQGSSMGLVVHGMSGFDYEKARRDLGVGDPFEVLAMFAVGRPGPTNEVQTGRKKGAEIAHEMKNRAGLEAWLDLKHTNSKS